MEVYWHNKESMEFEDEGKSFIGQGELGLVAGKPIVPISPWTAKVFTSVLELESLWLVHYSSEAYP